ncbi:MAG: LysE/ArgO family amino acid transporter [Pseudomonadota bacterium]
MIAAATTGFFSGLSLILAIGAQNAFVLRQGLQRSHVFAVCLLCAASDAILITLGVFGFGALVEALPWLPKAMAVFGICFLIYYAAIRLIAACRGAYEMEISGTALPLGATLVTAAAFTWLNPHVYLDTVVLLGSISLSFEDNRMIFWGGAVIASFVFFFSLGYGARLLAPIMQTAKAWRILDVAIAMVMLAIVAKLVIYLVSLP